jgi:hypothetical protein
LVADRTQIKQAQRREWVLKSRTVVSSKPMLPAGVFLGLSHLIMIKAKSEGRRPQIG